MATLFDDFPDCNDDLPEGERRKEQAFEKLETHRDSVILAGRRAFITHAIAHGTATADDVRNAVSVPSGINPKCLGPVPSPFAKANIIRAKRQVKTRRAVGHARYITEWELIDPIRAQEWLRSNPDPLLGGEGVSL